MTERLQSHFLLDPSIHFLNHGSFGACPQPVFEVYQSWQRCLEFQPVQFFGLSLREYLQQARQALGEFFRTHADNLVFIPNATYGVNIVSRSLALNPGDEILTTDHEYGACDYAWEFACQRNGAVYIHQAIPLPAQSSADLAEQFWQGVTPRTKVIYLSHITSPTALRLPVETICARARLAGILTLIDGAHAPGQMDLDLEKVGADFYTGNCHKWMLSPKGAGFLYARPEVQSMIQPLVVSWGYHTPTQTTLGSQFLDYLSWSGTKDPAAYLSVPAAIQFMDDHRWDRVRQACHILLRQTIQRICALAQTVPAYPVDSDLYLQMGIAPLPTHIDPGTLKKRLYDEYRVEIPVVEWQGRKHLRISVQAYNTPEDLDALSHGLETLLPQVRL